MKAIFAVLLVPIVAAGCSSGGADGPTPDATFINRMVRKTGGDASKLSPDERAQMDKITKGETEAVLRMGASNALPPAPVRNGG